MRKKGRRRKGRKKMCVCVFKRIFFLRELFTVDTVDESVVLVPLHACIVQLL